MTEWQVYEQTKTRGRLSRTAQAESKWGARPVFGERVDLELRSGLMELVHPLSGHFGGHLRFPQHDEKS